MVALKLIYTSLLFVNYSPTDKSLYKIASLFTVCSAVKQESLQGQESLLSLIYHLTHHIVIIYLFICLIFEDKDFVMASFRGSVI